MNDRKIVIQHCNNCPYIQKTTFHLFCPLIKQNFQYRESINIPQSCPLKDNNCSYEQEQKIKAKENYINFQKQYWDKQSIKWSPDVQLWIEKNNIKIYGTAKSLIFCAKDIYNMPISLILQLTGRYGFKYINIEDNQIYFSMEE